MTYEVQLVELAEQPAAQVRGQVGLDGIGEFLGPAFGEVLALLERQSLHAAGPPFGRYRPNADGGWDVEAGFPATGPVAAEGRVEPTALPAGQAARTMHVGPYSGVGAAYEAVTNWLSSNDYVPAGATWESYLDGPSVANPRTEIFFPVTAASRPG